MANGSDDLRDLIIYWLQVYVEELTAAISSERSVDFWIEYLLNVAAFDPSPANRLICIKLVSVIISEKLDSRAQFVALKDMMEHEQPSIQGECFNLLRQVFLKADEVGQPFDSFQSKSSTATSSIPLSRARTVSTYISRD